MQSGRVRGGKVRLLLLATALLQAAAAVPIAVSLVG
jgi:hypothetical protein